MAKKKKQKQTPPNSSIFRVWYRSVKADGTLHYESSSLYEVLRVSEGEDVTYHSLTQKLVTGNWEQMSKKELRNAGVSHYIR